MFLQLSIFLRANYNIFAVYVKGGEISHPSCLFLIA
jgi:hypothetical protein